MEWMSVSRVKNKMTSDMVHLSKLDMKKEVNERNMNHRFLMKI